MYRIPLLEPFGVDESIFCLFIGSLQRKLAQKDRHKNIRENDDWLVRASNPGAVFAVIAVMS